MNERCRTFELVWPEDPVRIITGQITIPAQVQAQADPWPIVVIAHGYALHKDWGFFPEISRRLAACGIASVRFNFSGHGVDSNLEVDESLFTKNSYVDELRDLELIRAWIEDQNDLNSERIGYVGHSRGGGMGLVHAAEDGRYRLVVTWASIEKTLQFTPERIEQWRRDGTVEVMHWTARRRMKLELSTLHTAEREHERLDIMAACGRIDCPVLAIHGMDDRAVNILASEMIVDACPHGELFAVEGGDHVFGARHPLRGVPEPLEQALARTVAVFAQL